MSNNSVTKANSLIDASYKLNVQAQKLVLACLSKIDPRPEKETPKEISLTATEFSNLMGIDKKNAHRELYKAADALFRSTIQLTENNEEVELYWIQEKAKKINIVKVISSILKRYLNKNISFVRKENIYLFIKLNSFKRCINNILSNSLKFANKINITYQKKKNHLLIIIDDDGPGIPPNERDKVLMPFYRIEN